MRLAIPAACRAYPGQEAPFDDGKRRVSTCEHPLPVEVSPVLHERVPFPRWRSAAAG